MKLKDDSMGCFSAGIELANNDDIVRALAGDISDEDIRHLTIRGVADSGATRLVIPESVARKLGLRVLSDMTVRYADGRIAQRQMAIGIHLTCARRSSVFNAIIEPGRDSALIGAIVLEDLDLVVDCTHQTLSPRDPNGIISVIE